MDAEVCGSISPETGACCQLPGPHPGAMHECGNIFWGKGTVLAPEPVDMVNHPPHYIRGPELDVSGAAGIDPGTIVWTLECIDVIRHVTDMRLATAMKYIWRVAFGGKENDREDIGKAIWYLQDWLDNPIT